MFRPLLVTPGMGVGPEITARALRQIGHDGVLLVGRAEPLLSALLAVGLPARVISHNDPWSPGELCVVDPGPLGGEPVEAASIRFAAEACLAGRGAAMVTGPIHKAKLVAQGFRYHGHTDMLADICGRDSVMAFVGGELRVALVTHHQPLMSVGASLTVDGICRTVRIFANALATDLGLGDAPIAVCGLNPHAGEQGVLGREELDIIGPACDQLREEGVAAVGPVSAETAFLGARAGRYAAVVAMYHDQGLAPLKAVDFGRSVNWTLGLPLVRTSVDHGTADDLVGTGRASHESMVAALSLARQIVARR